mgnify:CR=1 FL=1
MAQKLPSGETSEAGFTLMELLMVLFILALLASISVPIVSSSLVRAKEAALLETLAVTRRSIDEYYSDKGVYPETLSVLVEEKYLRTLPQDPFVSTGSGGGWILVYDADNVGIQDLHSTSPDRNSENTAYRDW